jgi:hypothetical protein
MAGRRLQTETFFHDQSKFFLGLKIPFFLKNLNEGVE